MKIVGYICGVLMALLLVAIIVIQLRGDRQPTASASLSPEDLKLVQDRPGGRGGRGGMRGMGGGMGGPGGMGGFGGPMVMGRGQTTQEGDIAFREFVLTLAELNLAPGFDLNKEQKDGIQAIRDGVKAAQDKWRKDHEADLKAIQDEMQKAREAMRDGGGPGAAPGAGGRTSMRDLMAKNQELWATYPKTDEAIGQIKELLTADQRKALDAKAEEQKAEREAARQQMQDRMRGGNSPGGQRAPGAPAGRQRRGAAGEQG